VRSYNGFTAWQRQTAFNWLKAEYAAGRRAKPVVCDGCGQDQGIISAHSEDYSAPFGDHIGQYGFCATCHRQVHCRFRNPLAWQAYRDAVRYRAAAGPTVLDQIEAARRPQSAVA
jgi:hypothetical protein